MIRHVIERFFAVFEATRDAKTFAFFRIAYFAGLALHFWPALIHLEENYGLGAVRRQKWSPWLFDLQPTLPQGLLVALSGLTWMGIVLGMVGFRPRIASCITMLGTYIFASFNALPVETLALANAWAILPVLCVCRGASAAWSVDAWWAQRKNRPPPAAPSYGANVILFQLLFVFFSAGVEKILWGWPVNNEMAMLFKTPQGWILRDWAWMSSWLRNDATGAFLSWATVLIELTVPVGFLFARTRLLAFAVYQAFFLGIVAAIEVPPLFYAMFAAGALIALTSSDRGRLVALFRKRGTSPVADTLSAEDKPCAG